MGSFFVELQLSVKFHLNRSRISENRSLLVNRLFRLQFLGRLLVQGTNELWIWNGWRLLLVVAEEEAVGGFTKTLRLDRGGKSCFLD